MTGRQRDLIRQAINQHTRQRVQKLDAEPQTECLYCAGPIPEDRLKRAAKYCCDNHRARAWNTTPKGRAGQRTRHQRLRARKKAAP